MTAPQIVVTVTAVLVVTSIALVSVGVGVVAGFGWALVCGGVLAGISSVAGCVVLLRDKTG